jgi:eukaryotic-like serine/threonine-protein kinase
MTPERYEQIGMLYQAALEREPAERAAFLAEACGADEALRREVASLIASHEQAGDFIEQPLDDVAAGWQEGDRPLPQSSFSHYRMLSLLGKGGMGEVWLAEDTQLGRKVAVKLLPAAFTTDAGRVRRFAQEAHAASALNHPNIITIYEIGEVATENGSAHYIVTEYVEGETLRQRMTSAPHNQMKLTEAVDVAAQVAAALTAAHHRGIAHRDIKPENVMVRRDGYVKVLDFGLAKLTEPSSPAVGVKAQTVFGASASTEAGMVMGTPRYMSPEQARGEKVDVRTDIFSLGVVLYEMVAGRPPFTGATASETIASILRDEPPLLTRQVPEAPPELERIVSRALRKDRAERYQHQPAKDLLNDLNLLKQEMLIGDPKSRTSRAASRNRRIHILSALVVLLLAAIAAWFYSKRPPVLSSKDTILLADFENKTGDEFFDVMLKQGLAIQLQQSPFLHLFPEAQMRHELRLMKRAPNERVTAEIAREICARQNLKALIAGAIAPLGSHYVITLEALNSQTGESLAYEQVQAENKEQVLRALSQVATRLRGRLGESLSSIQRFDKPLVEATTSKLEAFKAWSLGVELSFRGKPMEAIPFYQRAVELDPEFAHAHSVLSAVYWATGRPGLAAEHAEKGYQLKDKVSEYEKLRITNFYHGFATGNLDKRIEALMLLKGSYPRESGAPTDLAYTYSMIGQYDQAVAKAREDIRLNPNFAPAHRALAWPLLRLNRFAEAKDVLAQALQQQKLDIPDSHTFLYQIAFIQSTGQSTGGDTADMQEQIGWARGKPYEYVAFDWQTGAAAYAGQWRKAQDFSRRAIDLAARGDTKEIAAQYAAEQALRGAMFGDCRRARADAEQGLKLVRGRASLPRAALALALCREANQARSLIEEMTKLYPEDTIINSIWLPVIRAAMELQRGNTGQAVEQLQPTSRYDAAAEFWPPTLRGQAYLKLGRGAEAAAEFQKILDHRGYTPLSPLYPLAHLGSARAAAIVGDKAKSRKSYEDFLASWKGADSDLPPMTEAKREYERK